jgi:hypothetical protein
LNQILVLLLECFQAEHGATAAERDRVLRHTQRLWWEVVRNAMRGGAPWLIARYATKPTPWRRLRPGLLDLAGSIAVGAARAAARGFLSEQKNPTSTG